tara:strand:+ start:276 stop:473 length:198 start_codon:yes stop_codon:yes gene_type:complete
MRTIEFTGTHIKAKEDLERMLKDAKWQVDFYTKQVVEAKDTLYARQLALECLENELNILNDVSQL